MTMDFSEFARAIGSIKTEKKTASSRANMLKIHQAKVLLECTCHETPHKYLCPIYHREAQRKSRERRQSRV